MGEPVDIHPPRRRFKTVDWSTGEDKSVEVSGYYQADSKIFIESIREL